MLIQIAQSCRLPGFLHQRPELELLAGQETDVLESRKEHGELSGS